MFEIIAVLALVAGIVFALVAVAFLARRRQGNKTGDVGAHADVVVSQVGTIDLRSILVELGVPIEDEAGLVVWPQNDGTALVIADEKSATTLGTIVGRAGPHLETITRRAASGVDVGVRAGERLGLLVHLHPESRAALDALGPEMVKDGAGYFLGTVRGEAGKWQHVVKLRELNTLSSLTSAAAVVSALATQAQLDRIERALGELKQSVAEGNRFARELEESRRRSLESLFSEIYTSAQAAGQLTPGQWPEIAPQVVNTYALRNQTVADLGDCIRKLRSLPKGRSARAAEVTGLQQRIALHLTNLDRDERLIAQAQVLRLWHYSVTADPALRSALMETRRGIADRAAERETILTALEGAGAAVDLRGLRSVLARGTRKLILEEGLSIEHEARSHRLALTGQDGYVTQVDTDAGWSPGDHPSGPADLGDTYTLTVAESAALAVAQTWLMNEELGVDPAPTKIEDARTFRAATVKAIAAVSGNEEPWLTQLAHARRSRADTSEVLRESVLERAFRNLSRERYLVLLVELATFHPWSPSDLNEPVKTAQRWSKKTRVSGLEHISSSCALFRVGDVQRVLNILRDAEQLGQRAGGRLVLLVGLAAVGVGIGALTAGLAAPLIGGFIGTTVFGLAGAAATSAGLAALGGGALAVGGAGMAGGTALVTAAGATVVGGLFAGTGTAVTIDKRRSDRLSAQVVVEVIKLYVLVRLVMLDELHDQAQSAAAVHGLRNLRDQLQRELADPGDGKDQESQPKREALTEIIALLSKVIRDLTLRRRDDRQQMSAACRQ